MFVGTALSVHLFVCAGLSLFIICGPYLSMVVCMFYAYNLTILGRAKLRWNFSSLLRDASDIHRFPTVHMV